MNITKSYIHNLFSYLKGYFKLYFNPLVEKMFIIFYTKPYDKASFLLYVLISYIPNKLLLTSTIDTDLYNVCVHIINNTIYTLPELEQEKFKFSFINKLAVYYYVPWLLDKYTNISIYVKLYRYK